MTAIAAVEENLSKESKSKLLAVSFIKTGSPKFKFAVEIAKGADVFFENEGLYICSFSKDKESAMKAKTLIGFVGKWKGTLLYSSGIEQNPIYILKVLKCYLEAEQCADPKAHCNVVIKDPRFDSFMKPKSFAELNKKISLAVNNKIQELDNFIFPCALLNPYFRYDSEHPSSLQNQVDALAIKRGCSSCPRFNLKDLVRVT